MSNPLDRYADAAEAIDGFGWCSTNAPDFWGEVHSILGDMADDSDYDPDIDQILERLDAVRTSALKPKDEVTTLRERLGKVA